MVRYWIQSSVKKSGALRCTVQRQYGKKGFDSKGRIKVSVLDELAKEPGVTGRRARFAKNIRK